jgi:hypothetical protein
MTDKEVGELWAKAKLPVVVDLIRKLVQERCHRSKLEQALRDFGIDPASWEDK